MENNNLKNFLTKKDCVKTDDVSENLYGWASGIKGLGIFFAIIIVIASFYFIDNSVVLFFSLLIIAFFTYSIYFSYSLLLKALASIVESNSIIARTCLNLAFGSKEEQQKEEEPEELKF